MGIREGNTLRANIKFTPSGPLKHSLRYDPDFPFLVPLTGRRVGKTWHSLNYLIERALICPKAEWDNSYDAPTYSDAYSIAWRKLLDMLDPDLIAKNHFGRPYIHETRLEITLINDNRISLHSADKKRTHQGRSQFTLVSDEVKDYPASYIDDTRPCFASTIESGASWILPTTPPQVSNWFTEWFTRVQAGDVPGFRAIPPAQSIDCWWNSKEEIEAAKKSMDSRAFRIEYEGSMETFAGLVYQDFTPQGNVSIEPLEYKPSLPAYYGVDIGYNDPFVILWGQYNAVSQTWFILREFVSPGMTPENTGKIFRNDELHTPQHKFKAGHWPFSIQQGEIYAGRDIEYKTMQGGGFSVRQQLEQTGVPSWAFRQQASAREFEGIQNVRSYILNAAGDRRLIIDPSCKTLIRDLQNFHYPEKNGLIIGEQPDPSPANHIYSHTLDALRYMIDGVTPLRKAVSWSGVSR